MHAAGRFSDDIQARNCRSSELIGDHTAILVMLGRIDEDRFFGEIDIVLGEAVVQMLEIVFDKSFVVSDIDHRGVQPDAMIAYWCFNAVAPVGYFSDDGRGHGISRFKLVDKPFPVYVHQLGAFGARGFTHQQTDHLGGKTGPRRVKLNRIDIEQSGPRPVSHHNPIRRGAIMVCRRKSLDMDSAKTAGGQDDDFGLDQDHLPGFDIHTNGSGTPPALVHDQLDCRVVLDDVDLLVQDLVAKDLHDGHPGIIANRMSPGAGVTASNVSFDKVSVLIFVKRDSQFLQPLNDQGRVFNQRSNHGRRVRKTTSTHGIDEMAHR